MSAIPAFEIGVWNAWIFMAWLLIQTLLMRLISKEAYQKASTPPDMKLNRPGRIANYVSTPLWLLSTAYSIFLPFNLGTVWFYAGLVIFILSLVINVIVTINFTNTPNDEPTTRGAYRYSRHPGYASLILIYFSVSIATASWIFLSVTIIWAFLLGISVKDEERYCLEKYGDSYREYMDRTPRWIGIPKPAKE
jgi:protein-S-isoprenylcysteine O-methyltransferase Ste14